MKRRRVFVPAVEIDAGRFLFSPGDSTYLSRVLRLGPGAEVEVFDGKNRYLVRLNAAKNKRVPAEVVGKIDESPSTETEITLAFGCVRPGPFSEILRHCTELGALRFVPILSLRTSRRPEERKDRWESLAASASAQSQRVTVPAVEAPVSLEDFLRRDFGDADGFVLSLASGAVSFPTGLCCRGRRDVVILVGPEGGFDDSEEALAVSAGFTPVSLGKAVLRTETAAIVAVGLAVSFFPTSDRGADRQETCD